MSELIAKVEHEGREYFFEWSTSADAPTTRGVTLTEFRDYYVSRYGSDGAADLDKRLERVAAFGTSSYHRKTFDDLVAVNRAGPNESDLTREGLIEWLLARDEDAGTGNRDDDGMRTSILDSDGNVLAYRIRMDDTHPVAIVPQSDPAEPLQMLTRICGSEEQLGPHIHKPGERSIPIVQEALVMLAGEMEAQIYDESDELAGTLPLLAGDAFMILRGGHGYKTGTSAKFVEFKNGPFHGKEKDSRPVGRESW